MLVHGKCAPDIVSYDTEASVPLGPRESSGVSCLIRSSEFGHLPREGTVELTWTGDDRPTGSVYRRHRLSPIIISKQSTSYRFGHGLASQTKSRHRPSALTRQ